MGVKGLTGFIARHAEIYLKPYELHDCSLVIDGDNLSCNLYKDVTGTYSAFSGDYDDYYRAVIQFFQVLFECNIKPFVLMDGGYEAKKLRTVAKRLRGKISVIKRINPCGSIPVFPIMMKEVFIDALKDCNVPVFRCMFEADDELAALSRKLNCPVLSYDSDFYIYNVPMYIPLITLTVKAHIKSVKNAKANADNPQEQTQPNRKLRKNEARHFEKLTKSNNIVGPIAVDSKEKSKKQGKSYKYLDCCIYRIEHLIARGALSKEKLPLFAALLGNDYIARSAFKNFYSAGLGKIGRTRKLKTQQRRIRVIMQWLKGETAESALQKILSRLKKNQRKSLEEQFIAATTGYSNETCISYDYFKENYKNLREVFSKLEARAAELDGEESVSASEEEDDEASDISSDDVEFDEDSELSDFSDNSNESEAVNGDEAQQQSNHDDEEENHLEKEGLLENVEAELDDTNDNDEDEVQRVPDWFLAKLYPANLPRFMVDLAHLKKYINSPQIEHFPHPDCHEIALPILIYIFTLLHRVDPGEQQIPVKQYFAEDGTTPLPLEFTYLTRAMRVTNIRYYRYGLLDLPPKYDFNPKSPNPLLFHYIFDGTMQGLNVETVFERIAGMPKHLQLYFLAIVYWLQKSQNCDLIHLHALIICVVVLQTIDAKIPAERDFKEFNKRFGKIIKKERLVRDKDAAEGKTRSIKEELKALPVPQRMQYITKSDCLLVQEKLLKHFHMQELFKKKYDTYSTLILHAFSEFQSIVFQMSALNALLDFPFHSSRMGDLYCGVFLYNIYDLLKSRSDVQYYVKNFIFPDSQMMFDYYCFLWDWCQQFIPLWKRPKAAATTQEQSNTESSAMQVKSKKQLKRQRQAARRKNEKLNNSSVDPNIAMVDHHDDGDSNEAPADAEEFLDLNNKFCELLITR